MANANATQKAQELFSRMTQLKPLSSTIPFWLNYATFLLTTRNDAPAAHALLLRATQSVPADLHRQLTAKFGALEYTSPNGDIERGRTVFEGLVDAWPKRGDLWDTYVDLERAKGEEEYVRGLFERMAKAKMKKKRARWVFKRWLEFEEGVGGDSERVKRLAAEWVTKAEKEEEVE